MANSPYLKNDARLAEVIAAIQAMSIYKFYKLDFAGWSDRISGHSGEGEHWRQVFVDHPEFFRLDAAREKASLVARRQHPKNYDVDARIQIENTVFLAMEDSQKARISRSPLSQGEIASLIQTAVELHSRAMEQARDRRWWLPVLTAFIGAASGIAGTLLGASLT
ncbi:hypothetical protein KBW81_18350 (plasmid) [Loktanella salsilacus]|uniref:hypothetical protein n=1 Tax=Loktanella salsilacus TaxID=195913 RepID=UPI0020B77A3F|nr:hypothetical protein [Loktanella salsilacus]UTH50140.1 hypothetical protein KBW81_18350 [Loktanella salsilacus]